MTLDISERTYSDAHPPGTAVAGRGSLSSRLIGRKPETPENSRRIPYIAPFTNRILSGLSQTVLAKIVAHLRPVYMRCDEYVYQPEDRIDHIYFPETAVFSEYQMLDDGRTIEIALMGKESAIGVASVFGPCIAVNWAQVCASGTALKIESELFRKIAGTESAVKALLNEHTNSYIRYISYKVICNTHHSVEERLCTWLLMLSDRCGQGTLKLTQEQIARVLGVYRPSVTCIARELKLRGLIDYVRGKITIRDRERLRAAACGCYEEFRSRPLKTPEQTFPRKVSGNVI